MKYRIVQMENNQYRIQTTYQLGDETCWRDYMGPFNFLWFAKVKLSRLISQEKAYKIRSVIKEIDSDDSV